MNKRKEEGRKKREREKAGRGRNGEKKEGDVLIILYFDKAPEDEPKRALQMGGEQPEGRVVGRV